MCSGKVPYESEGIALVSGDEVNKYRSIEGKKKLNFEAYKCDECQDWHLTSK